jgi:hypothetical protein
MLHVIFVVCDVSSQECSALLVEHPTFNRIVVDSNPITLSVVPKTDFIQNLNYDGLFL